VISLNSVWILWKKTGKVDLLDPVLYQKVSAAVSLSVVNQDNVGFAQNDLVLSPSAISEADTDLIPLVDVRNLNQARAKILCTDCNFARQD
jgi:hypothetical protein